MTHTDPFRLRVLQAMQACLREINPTNGSQFDLSQAVYVGRDKFGDDDPVPLVCILESAEEEPSVPSSSENPNRLGPWPLLIQGFVETQPGDQPLAPAYHLAAQVEQRLAREKIRCGREANAFGMNGMVDQVYYSKSVVRPADGEVSDKAYFWLRVTLRIAENLLDPYE